MLQLVVDGRERVDPVVPVGWCVDKETRESMVKNRVENPYILLVVVQREEGRVIDEERYLVPLSESVRFLEFHRPGLFTVYGVIVSRKGSVTPRGFRQWYLGRESPRSFKNCFFDDEGALRSRWMGEYIGEDIASLDIVVAEGFFAKRPSSWLARFLDYAYEFPARNQCEWRRRVAFFPLWFCLALILCLLNTLYVLIVAGTGLSLGRRGISLRGICWYPESPAGISDIWTYEPYPWFFLTTADGKDRLRLYWLGIPLIWLVAFAICGVVAIAMKEDIWFALFWTMVALLGFGLSMTSDIAITSLQYWRKARQKESSQPIPGRTKEERLRWLYRGIVCPGPEVSVQGLMNERMTVRLRVQKLKAMVCRPFSR